MNLTQMLTRVYHPIRDANRSFVTQSMVVDWLNDAQLDLAARLRIYKKEVTGTTPGGGTISLPANFLEADTLRLDADDVEWVDDDTFWSWKDSGDVQDHTLGRVFSTDIEMWPVPTTGTAYALRYVAKPTELVVSSQETCDLPTELHPKMVDFAISRAMYHLGEESHGDRYLSFYETGLEENPLARKRQSPGALAMRPIPGTFDASDSMHI